MKIINFTAKEILPALLDKSKTQTIRPAWKRTGAITPQLKFHYVTIDKPPRFKVGEKVKLMWNQRSTHKWFCPKCLKGGDKILDDIDLQGFSINEKDIGIYFIENSSYLSSCDCKKEPFNKLLGTAEITEVFEIEMSKSPSGKSYMASVNGCYLSKRQYEDLAKRDGFKSAEDMFKWFDKAYDLSKPKKFYVYRWIL